MSGSLEEAYVAVERAYGQGDFASALQLAQALRPQVQTGRPDLMDQRLQLLLGHIHLYGLNQPGPAATAYAAVLETCNEPAYRDLASQGLDLSREQTAAAPVNAPETAGATPWEPAAPGSAALEIGGTPGARNASPQRQPTAASPAIPWLSQLQDPLQALQQIQTAPAAVAPTAAVDTAPGPGPKAAAATAPDVRPEAKAKTNAGEVADAQAAAEKGGRSLQPADEPPSGADTDASTDPKTIIPVVVTVEEDIPIQELPEASASAGTSASADMKTMAVAADLAEPTPPRFSEEEWANLSLGLLLVELSNSQKA
jgi:hypothetical protein